MTDENIPAAPGTDQAEFQQSLRNRGFEPGEPVHEFEACFTVEEAQASLFASTYSSPMPVFLTGEDGTVRVPVVLDQAHPRYAPFRRGEGATPVGCYELPDWIFEGWIVPSGYDATTSFVRVRLWVASDFDSQYLWQVMSESGRSDGEILVVAG